MAVPRKRLATYMGRLGLALGFCWSVYQLGIGFTRGLPELVFLPLHVLFAVAVTFAFLPAWRSDAEEPEQHSSASFPVRSLPDIATSLLAIVVAVALALYFIVNSEAISRRIPMVMPLDTIQLVVGALVLLLVLEATRRTAGLGMLIVVGAFILYAIFGHLMPGPLASTSMPFADFIDQQVFTTSGVFGVPTAISATYVFYFVLFAAFLEFSGGGRLFIDLSMRVTRHARGGAAKAAILSSGLIGMSSGSAVANVMSTGVFTIPLMKEAGYKPRMAAAAEALASTGGQIMPPIMGAAAFIMANTLGMPYGEIIKAAALPALLYFFVIFVSVDLEARRAGMKPGDLPMHGHSAGYLRRLHLLIPLIYLVYSVVTGRSLMMSAVEAIGLSIVASWVLPESRLTFLPVINALARGGSRVISVAVPCAAAGIVVGVVSQTGIGIRFTELLVSMSLSSLFLALVVVMIGCLIMGMGLPTTAAYIMAATLFAPALVRLGIEPLAAHFFVFYFACLSMITPPVALASYAAASIAGTSASAAGWTGALVGFPLFLLPFAFVMETSLLGQGEVLTTIVHLATGATGALFFVATTRGFLIVRNNLLESGLFLLGGAGLFFPHTLTAVLGLLAVAAGTMSQLYRAKRISPPLGEKTSLSGAQNQPQHREDMKS